jgi:hypothetical protein
MSCATFEDFVKRLPEGRARTKQERLAQVLGETWIVQVSYSHAPLWLVEGKPQAQALCKHGTPRWCVWTLAELQDFLGACSSPVASLKEAAQVLESECPMEGESSPSRWAEDEERRGFTHE